MRFLAVALLAILVASASAALLQSHEYDTLFRHFEAQHSKQYSSLQEREKRAAIFRANLDFIIRENASGKNSHTLGMNQFGDLTAEEFRALVSRPLSKTEKSDFVAAGVHNYNGEQLPASVDWVAKGKVTAIKNQGQCGSCWAFSTTGSVEGAWAIAKNQLVSLSEQDLVDCSTQDSGCDGGLMDNAFQDIIKMGGLESESAYPYTAQTGTCQFNKKMVVATISSYKDVTPNNNQALMSAVAQQPVSVAIYAASSSFQFYSGGIINDPSCPSDSGSLDHGVLVVGYGSSSGQDYYKLKNSWGTSWGEAGFFRFARGDNVNQCGVLDLPSYPVV